MFVPRFIEPVSDYTSMGSTEREQPPLLQRLYDRIWLLGVAALVFWAISYVVWGVADIFSVPTG